MSDDSAIRIATGSASAEEIAAVTAVVQGALDELAAAADLEDGSRVSAWQRSQRGLRTPLLPGPGVWRSFSG